MSVTINGTTGVSLVQNGVLTDANMPAGSVLQVVQSTYSSVVSSSSGSYTDTGLSGSITPTSAASKVLVLVMQPMRIDRGVSDNWSGMVRLLRGSTSIWEPGNYTIGFALNSGSSGKLWQYLSFSYLDSPSTTSSITYKTQMAADSSGLMNAQVGSSPSTIILMEIAA